MKSCEKCAWCRYDYTTEKVFMCKIEHKNFNYPRLHGMLYRHYANKLIEKGARNENKQDIK